MSTPLTPTSDVVAELHANMVRTLCKTGAAIIDDLTPAKAHLWHMATGISGEAGELLDATKKFAIYDKVLDRENVVEELGDLMFYITGMAQTIGVTMETILSGNLAKLGKRYGQDFKYTNAAAIARADKQ